MWVTLKMYIDCVKQISIYKHENIYPHSCADQNLVSNLLKKSFPKIYLKKITGPITN